MAFIKTSLLVFFCRFCVEYFAEILLPVLISGKVNLSNRMLKHWKLLDIQLIMKSHHSICAVCIGNASQRCHMLKAGLHPIRGEKL